MEQFGALFLRVLTVSAGCSAVLALLLALLPKLREKIAARSLYVLFLVLALRLLLPVEIKLPAPAVTVSAPDYALSVPTAQSQVQHMDIHPLPDLQPVTEPVPAARKVPVVNIFAAVWAAGMAACAVWSAGSCLLARRKLLRGSVPGEAEELALLERLRQELRVARPVALRRSVSAPGPLALGLFRPVIVLPERLWDADGSELMLRHELTHIRRRDVAYKLVMYLACWVNWFNPLVWLMNRAAGQNLELCCDDEVTRGLTDAQRRQYGTMLLDAAAARPIPFSTCFSGGKAQMKDRIFNLFAKKRSSAALVCLVLVAALLAGGLVSCETNQSSAWTSDLLEFPGTRWNDPAETVLESLKLDPEQIIADESSDEDGKDNMRTIVVEGISCFGGTANAVLRFVRYAESGADQPHGLFRVELIFSDDTDMDAVKAELTRLYGEGSQEKREYHYIRDGKVVTMAPQQDGVASIWPWEEEQYSYLRTPNEHSLYWQVYGKDLLPEELDEGEIAAKYAQANNPATADVVSQWLDQVTLAQMTWTDGYVLTDGSIKTHNMVTFEGSPYTSLVYHYGRSAAQADAGPRTLSAVTPENQTRRALLKDYFYENYQEDNTSVVLADLTGDGLDEMIVLSMHSTSDTELNLRKPVTAEQFAYGGLTICGVKEGSEVFPYESLGDVASAHVGWGYLYLVPRPDGDGFALLKFSPYIGQGLAGYNYAVYGSEYDEWLWLDGGEAYFSLDPVEAMGPDIGDDATVEEVQAFLDRAQAYRDSGVPLLCFYSDGAKNEFRYLNAAPADTFAGKLDTLPALRGCVVDNGYTAQFPLPPAGPASPEEALDRLEASVEAYPDGYVFRIPNYKGEWNVHIAGRMRMDDMSHPYDPDIEDPQFMSVHFLEDEEWKPGKRYNFDTGDAYFSELTLTASVTGPDGNQAERTITLTEPQDEVDSSLPDNEEENPQVSGWF